MIGGSRPEAGRIRRPSLWPVLGAIVAPALVLAFSSGAQACSLTEPTCVLEKTEQTVDDVKDPVGDVVGTVEEGASEAGESTKETVTDVVDDVDKGVPRAVGIPDTSPPQPGNEGATPDPGSPPATDPAPERVRGAAERAATDPAEGARLVPDSFRPPADVSLAALSRSDPAIAAPTAQSTPPDSDDLSEAIRRFAFPLLLSALVALFLLFQNRVDRRDPKIALAPLDAEVVLFE